MRVAILTLSDKGARGEREDLSGPALSSWLALHSVEASKTELLSDDLLLISSRLETLVDGGEFDLILTTGGTGVSPRDVTPEATQRILDREIPGFGEAMRASSFKKTPYAILSRATAGIRKQTLIINLPGSPKGAVENLESIWPAVLHAVGKIQGDTQDCIPAQ